MKTIFLASFFSIIVSVVSFSLLYQFFGDTAKEPSFSAKIRPKDNPPLTQTRTPTPTPSWQLGPTTNCSWQFRDRTDNGIIISLCIDQNFQLLNGKYPTYTFATSNYNSATESGPQKSDLYIQSGQFLSFNFKEKDPDQATDQNPISIQEDHRITRETSLLNGVLHTLGLTKQGIALDAHISIDNKQIVATYHYNPKDTPNGEASFRQIMDSLSIQSEKP